MASKEILEWIKQQESKGYNPNQVYDYLIKKGYNPNEVSEAIRIANSNTNPNNNSSPKKSSKKILMYSVISIVVLLILAVGGFFAFNAFSNTPDDFGYVSSNSINDNELAENNIENDESGVVAGNSSIEVVNESNDESANTKDVKDNVTKEVDCIDFPNMLEECSPYLCEFTHPFTGDLLVKEIIGEEDDVCMYYEEMPNDGEMVCEYPTILLVEVAQYYKDIMEAESFGMKSTTNLTGDGSSVTYTINGKEVENPIQEALNDGICEILGY
jgi:hypothetical protein